jgi:hypothetical protein
MDSYLPVQVTAYHMLSSTNSSLREQLGDLAFPDKAWPDGECKHTKYMLWAR